MKFHIKVKCNSSTDLLWCDDEGGFVWCDTELEKADWWSTVEKAQWFIDNVLLTADPAYVWKEGDQECDKYDWSTADNDYEVVNNEIYR